MTQALGLGQVAGTWAATLESGFMRSVESHTWGRKGATLTFVSTWREERRVITARTNIAQHLENKQMSRFQMICRTYTGPTFQPSKPACRNNNKGKLNCCDCEGLVRGKTTHARRKCSTLCRIPVLFDRKIHFIFDFSGFDILLLFTFGIIVPILYFPQVSLFSSIALLSPSASEQTVFHESLNEALAYRLGSSEAASFDRLTTTPKSDTGRTAIVSHSDFWPSHDNADTIRPFEPTTTDWIARRYG